MRYTPRSMQLVIYITLALIIAFVTIDALARLDERCPRTPRDETAITTQKIVIDLDKRR
jgi:hypothetical protein